MKKQRAKNLSQDACDYMNSVWGFSFSSEVTDTQMFWSEAEYECVAKLLVDAGAVEPNCKEAKEIVAVAKSISHATFQRRARKLLKNYTTMECTKCNYTHFIPAWCEPNDWQTGGCEGCLAKNSLTKGGK